VAPGTLGRSVDALIGPPVGSPSRLQHKRIALVHHVPCAFSSESKFGSRMEEAFLNTNHAKMYLAINTIAIDSCVVGKSNLYRRSDLERVNGSLKRIPPGADDGSGSGLCGLAAFGNFLAEDNMIASALWHELGDRHDLSCDVARNAVGNMTVSEYIWRRIRWIRVRKHIVLAATIAEPFTECVVVSFLAAACLKHLFDFPPWLFLVLHYAIWLAVDLDVYSSLAGHPLPAEERWQFLSGWAAREILALPIWIFAMFGNEVVWRGKKYQVLRNGKIERASSNRRNGIFSWFGWTERRRDLEGYERVDGHTLYLSH
jgi:ceramide glucosyltransferase